MTARECPELDQAAEYVMGLLRGPELAAFRGHLDRCAACQVQVQELAALAELLPYAALPQAPPVRLRARLLGAIPALGGPPAASPASTATVFARSRVRVPVWAAAAMVALTSGVGILGWRLQSVSQEVARLAAASATAAGGSAPVIQGTAATRAVTLAATNQAPGAGGGVMVVPEHEGMYLYVWAVGLGPLAGDQVYHLWLLKDGQRTSGGTFRVNSDGLGGVATHIPAGVQFDAVGITLEPDARGMTPRGQKVLGANL